MKPSSKKSAVGVIYKNVIVLGFGFMLHFTAFGGTSALQSSINPAGLGTAALATLYVAMMLGNLFLPSVVIRWLGCKWTVVISAVTYMPYIAAQYYPSYATLIPAAVIIGIGASTLWVGHNVYVMQMARQLKLVAGTPEEVGSSRFFGITSTLLSASSIWGSLVSSTGRSDSICHAVPMRILLMIPPLLFISALGWEGFHQLYHGWSNYAFCASATKFQRIILAKFFLGLVERASHFELDIGYAVIGHSNLGSATSAAVFTILVLALSPAQALTIVQHAMPTSHIFSTDDKFLNSTRTQIEKQCGSQYTPKYEFENHRPNLPSTEKIYTVLGIYLVCMVMCCLSLSAGLSSVPRSTKKVEEKKSLVQLLLSTITALKDPKIFLLMPITFSAGLTAAFNSADYNQAFIACGLGVQFIGFVTICEGVCSALSALASGWLAKYTGRIVIVITITILTLALYIFLLFWRPSSEDITIYFIVSGVIGICGGVWGVHIKAIGGQASAGRKEAFYSNFGLVESLGFIIGYSYSYYLPTWVKIVVVIISNVIGTIGFVAVDLIIRSSPSMYTVQQ